MSLADWVIDEIFDDAEYLSILAFDWFIGNAAAADGGDEGVDDVDGAMEPVLNGSDWAIPEDLLPFAEIAEQESDYGANEDWAVPEEDFDE